MISTGSNNRLGAPWVIKKKEQAYCRAATDRQPYKMGVLKIEISLTRSNFAVHIIDFDIHCIPLGATYVPNFEVPCPVV